MCLHGASSAGAGLLEAIAGNGLRAYYVWVPMLPGDSHQAALSASERFAGPRATHYWDGGHDLARHMAAALGIQGRESIIPEDKPGFAWDVYLAYRRHAVPIEQPDFWMHQLAVDHAPRLDIEEWNRRIGQMMSESGA